MTPFSPPRPFTTVTFHYFEEEGTHLGSIRLTSIQAQYSQLYICKNCSRTVGRIIAQNEGYISVYHFREVRCAECGGDDSLFFQPYIYSFVFKVKQIPAPLLKYEINAAIEGNTEWRYSNPLNHQLQKKFPSRESMSQPRLQHS